MQKPQGYPLGFKLGTQIGTRAGIPLEPGPVLGGYFQVDKLLASLWHCFHIPKARWFKMGGSDFRICRIGSRGALQRRVFPLNAIHVLSKKGRTPSERQPRAAGFLLFGLFKTSQLPKWWALGVTHQLSTPRRYGKIDRHCTARSGLFAMTKSPETTHPLDKHPQL